MRWAAWANTWVCLGWFVSSLSVSCWHCLTAWLLVFVQWGCHGVLQRVCHIRGPWKRLSSKVFLQIWTIFCYIPLHCSIATTDTFTAFLRTRLGLSQLEGFRRHLLEVLQKSNKPKVTSSVDATFKQKKLKECAICWSSQELSPVIFQ